MRRLIFLNICIIIASGQLCDDDNSVDLSDALLQGGFLVKDGVQFPPEYVYSKNVSGEMKHFGCACKFNKCFRKCCPLGQVFHIGPKIRNCTESLEYDDLVLRYGFNVSYTTSYVGNIKFNYTKGCSFFYGRPCNGEVYLENDYEWFIQEDGKLYLEVPNKIPPYTLLDVNKYCIDTFIFEDDNGVKTSDIDALVCFAEDKDNAHYGLSSTCMLISCVFILATVTVYAWLPELRNLHGLVLMAYLISLFVAFIILGTMQILVSSNNITPNACISMAFIIYFALLSAFFWLNVMCFDIWWTFSGKRGMATEKIAKFYTYCKYAFGVPTLLTALLIGLEFSGLPRRPFLPAIRQEGCFLSGDTKLLYLYGPIVIISVVNMIFFTLTALKIAEIKKQTSVLKTGENATHTKKERQRLLLYVKLFAVMGVSWILEVISHIFPEAEKFWRFTDAYNVLIGVLVFFIFVCKRKIFRLMKKRYKQVRGGSISKSQSSSRTYTTRDELALTSRN